MRVIFSNLGNNPAETRSDGHVRRKYFPYSWGEGSAICRKDQSRSCTIWLLYCFDYLWTVNCAEFLLYSAYAFLHLLWSWGHPQEQVHNPRVQRVQTKKTKHGGMRVGNTFQINCPLYNKLYFQFSSSYKLISSIGLNCK